MALQANLEKLRNVETPLVGVGSKPVKVKGSVELPITLRERDWRRTVR